MDSSLFLHVWLAHMSVRGAGEPKYIDDGTTDAVSGVLNFVVV